VLARLHGRYHYKRVQASVALILKSLFCCPGFERELHIAAVFLNDSELAPAITPANKAQEIVAMSVLDLLSSVLYFGCTLALIWYSRRLAAQADTSTVTVHDYSIRIEELPSDATAQELLGFFEQYGEVRYVCLI
jgi:hypothetical protein